MAKVLVLDADEDFRESARLVLERAGHDAHASSDAAAALRMVESGWRVIIDDEAAPGLARELGRDGVRVIPVAKPIAPVRLLAAIEGQ